VRPGATPAHGQQGRGAVKRYVTSSQGDGLHVIDLNTLRVAGCIQTTPHPLGAAVSGDGQPFFTTVESDHTLLVFDTATDQLLKRVKLSGLPNPCAARWTPCLVAHPGRAGGHRFRH
jgi:DNA-binding beta-propeller fold protein YncE